MDTKVALQTDRRKQFRPRTIKWCWISSITVVGTLGAMLVTGWRIGSPELLVVTVATLCISWLIVGIVQSRGKFRILSMLVVCAIVAILSSMVIPRMRIAAAHRRLVSKVTDAGGSVMTTGRRNSELNGWVVSNQGLILPKIFSPVINYLEGGVVERLTIPVDLIDDELVKETRFSKRPYFCLIFRGTHRDYKAIEALIRAASRDTHLFIDFSNLAPDDTAFLTSLRMRLLFTFRVDPHALHTKEIGFKEMQAALNAEPAEITIPSGITIASNGWDQSKLRFQSETGIGLIGQKCNAAFLNALNSDERMLDLRLISCQLNNEEWNSLSNLNCLKRLTLTNCSPTENQLLQLMRIKTLKSLSITEPSIGDSCLQELSKIGTLTGVYLPYIRQQDTLCHFLQNNHSLRNFTFPQGVLEGTNDPRLLEIQRSKLETQLQSKGIALQ